MLKSRVCYNARFCHMSSKNKPVIIICLSCFDIATSTYKNGGWRVVLTGYIHGMCDVSTWLLKYMSSNLKNLLKIPTEKWNVRKHVYMSIFNCVFSYILYLNLIVCILVHIGKCLMPESLHRRVLRQQCILAINSDWVRIISKTSGDSRT